MTYTRDSFQQLSETYSSIVEAKVDKNYSRQIPDQRDTNELSKKRNERNAKPGENRKIDDKAFITRKPGESEDSARARARSKVHKDERGVKKNRGEKPGKEKVETRARRFARAKALAKRKEFEGTIKQDSKGHHALENQRSVSSKERLEKSFKKDSKGHHSLENQFVPDNGIVEAKCDCNCGEVPCKKCGGDHHATEEKKLPDMRELPTRVNLVKNKLRAMGLKMSQKLTGDQLLEVAKYSIKEGDYHSGQGEKIQKRTKKWMEKKGQEGAPGLDAMKERTKEHKEKRGVKEEVVSELNRYEKETGKSSGSLNMRKGKATQKGGTKDPVMRSVRTSIRKETGKPEGQQRRGYDQRHAAQNRKESPASTIIKRREIKSRADAAMRDTSGT